MKRLICGLLSLIMCLSLLTACDSKPEAPQEEPVTETPAEEPAADVPEEPAGSGLHLDKLPDIGEFVDDAVVKYYFEDGVHDKFTPGDDYGMLINYFSSMAYYSYIVDSEDGSPGSYGQAPWAVQRGIAAADGRIIMEGLKADYAEFSPGKGIISLNNEADDIWLVSGFDGSWCIESSYYETLFGYGLPYFLAQTGGTAFVYDLNGEKRLDITRFMNHGEDSIWMPDVVYATDDIILFEGVPDKNDPQVFDFRNGVTAVGMDGEIKNTLAMDAPDYFSIRYLGGRVISAVYAYEDPPEENYDFEPRYKLYTVDLEPVSQNEYEYLNYDKESDTIIAKRGNTVDFFSGDGKSIRPENKWAGSKLNILSEWSGVFYNGCKLILSDFDTSEYYDVFGNELVFDLPSGSVKGIAILDSCEPECAFVLSDDGRGYVCGLDGTVKFETACPYYRRETEIYNMVSAEGDWICLLDRDGLLHIYSISKGAEELVMEYPGADEIIASLYPYISVVFNGDFMEILYDTDDDMRYSLYHLPDGKLLGRNLLEVSCQSGYAAAASLTHSTVYSPEGKVILRFRFESAD